jgi:hypothetical protein
MWVFQEAVLRNRLLFARFSTWRPGFNAGLIYVRFEMKELVLKKIPFLVIRNLLSIPVPTERSFTNNNIIIIIIIMPLKEDKRAKPWKLPKKTLFYLWRRREVGTYEYISVF